MIVLVLVISVIGIFGCEKKDRHKKQEKLN